jgi:hypothetical protein
MHHSIIDGINRGKEGNHGRSSPGRGSSYLFEDESLSSYFVNVW